MREDVDDFVAFHNVRVVSSAVPALFCAVGGKRVWLPRRHITGNLRCRGDRGTLGIRRWVALDRQLSIPDASVAVRLPCRSVPGPDQTHRLHLLGRNCGLRHGD